MVEPGTYPDPDEPQALTPDAVYVPEAADDAPEPSPVENFDAGEPIEEIEPVAADAPTDGASAAARPLGAARAALAGLAWGTSRGLALVWAYPRAAVAVGLSALVLCGVLSLKRGRSPVAEIPPPAKVQAAPTADEDNESVAVEPDVKVADAHEPAGLREEPKEKPAPPAVAPASFDGVKRTAVDLDDVGLPPEVDLPPEVAPEPAFASGPPDLDASPINALLAFNDPKPDEDDVPSPAPAAEAPDVAPAPAKAAADLPPEITPSDPPAPAPAAAPEPTPAADLPPEIAPSDDAVPAPSPTKEPSPQPDPEPKPEPQPQPEPAVIPKQPKVPAVPDEAAPMGPAIAPSTEPAPAAPPPASEPAVPPSVLPAFEAAPSVPTPAPAPAPVSTPRASDSSSDGDWIPIKHSSGPPRLTADDMEFSGGEPGERSGRWDEFFGDAPPSLPAAPVRVATPPVSVAAPAAVATRAAGADSSPRVDERMDTILHKVRPGENFWTISRTHYASGRYYKALGKANSDQFQRLQDLYVGAVIRIPPPEDLDPSLIEPAGGRSARDVDPDAPDPQPVQIASEGSSLRRSRRVYGELDLPDTDPETARASDRDDRRHSPRDEYDAPASRRAPPIHRVRPRETLRSIARDRLGDARRDREILELNRDAIPDPARLTPGQVLDLPDDAE